MEELVKDQQEMKENLDYLNRKVESLGIKLTIKKAEEYF
jgi:hypothetical protein